MNIFLSLVMSFVKKVQFSAKYGYIMFAVLLPLNFHSGKSYVKK